MRMMRAIKTPQGELTRCTPHRTAVRRLKRVVLNQELRIRLLEKQINLLLKDAPNILG